MANQKRHIAISGELGSGKSTVARKLAEKYGHKLVRAGDINRSIAASMHLSEVEVNLAAEKDNSIDKQIDSATRELAKASRPTVFDARVAWKIVDDAFKVHLLIDPAVAAQRLFLSRSSTVENYNSVDEAREALDKRYASERRRYRAQFGIDEARLENYDLVIDTTDATVDQILSEIESVYETESADGLVLRVSPRRLLPGYDTKAVRGDEEDRRPRVVYARPKAAFLDGCAAIQRALEEKRPFVEVDLVAEGGEKEERSKKTAQELIANIDPVWIENWARQWGLNL